MTPQALNCWAFADWLVNVYRPAVGHGNFLLLRNHVPPLVEGALFIHFAQNGHLSSFESGRLYMKGVLTQAGLAQPAREAFVFEHQAAIEQEMELFQNTCLPHSLGKIGFEYETENHGPFSIDDAIQALEPCGFTLRVPDNVHTGRFLCHYRNHFTSIEVSGSAAAWFDGCTSIQRVS